MKIRVFAPEDVVRVASLGRKAFASGGWTENDFLHLAGEDGGNILVAADWDDKPGEIAGFIAFRQLLDQAEILNLAVDPACQRQGVAKALIQSACSTLRENNVQTAFLEVRPSNRAALELYASAGFTRAAVRKGYYCHPDEDAYVLRLSLCPA